MPIIPGPEMIIGYFHDSRREILCKEDNAFRYWMLVLLPLAIIMRL